MHRSLCGVLVAAAAVFCSGAPLSPAALMPPPDKRSSESFSGKGDYVVVVHGWAWMRASMRDVVKTFHRSGFHVVSIQYDPRKEMPDAVVRERIAPAVAKFCTDPSKRIHFVGHSMGCLLIRHFLETAKPSNAGRALYLAPPNNGIELVDRYGDRKWFRLFFGEPARLLGTDADSLPQSLRKDALVETGIIMGKNGAPILSGILPGEDDGIVSVESGKLKGMRAFLVHERGHIFLPGDKPTLEQAIHFVRHGRFRESMADDAKKKGKRWRKKLAWPLKKR